MSIPEVTARLNSFSNNWYGARAVIEEELKAISKALERIRTSSQLQDELTEHLLAVHRQWCEACPPTQEPGHRGEGLLLEKEAPGPGPTSCAHSRVAAAASNPQQVSATVETAEIVNGPQSVGGEVDDNNDIDGSSIPLSMTSHMEDEEVQSGVNRTLEKASAEKGVSTTFIKVEALEDDQYPDILLKLEKDHNDVDVDSNNMETTSHQRHEEEEPSQHTESDGKFHLRLANTVPDEFQMKHEEDSQEYCDLDMDGNSSKATSDLGRQEEIPLDQSDGTNNSNSALNCDGLSAEGVSDDQFSVGLDSNKTDQRTLRSDDGTDNASSTLNCDVLSPEGVSDDQLSVGLESNKRDQKTSRSDDGTDNASFTQTCNAGSSEGVSRNSHSDSAGLDSYRRAQKTSRSDDGTDVASFTRTCNTHSSEGVSKNSCSAGLDSYKRVQRTSKSDDKMIYQCSDCRKRFFCRNEYQKHLSTQSCHKPRQCSVCSKSFSRTKSSDAHMKKHNEEKPSKYDHCISTKGTLKVPIRMHTGPYKCSSCDKSYRHKQSMEYHMMVHRGEKPFKCDHCSYRCAQKSHLKVHMRKHTKEKPFKCDFCTFRTGYTQALIKHKRIHSGEKPYSCDVCDYRSSHKGNLTMHKRVHTGEKPYQCSLCGKRFRQSCSLKPHMKIHTGQKPSLSVNWQDLYTDEQLQETHTTLLQEIIETG